MKGPFNTNVSIGNIQLLGSAGDRSELINGNWLPMKDVNGYMIRAQQRRVIGKNKEAALPLKPLLSSSKELVLQREGCPSMDKTATAL